MLQEIVVQQKYGNRFAVKTFTSYNSFAWPSADEYSSEFEDKVYNGIAQTGSFFNHTHNVAGLTFNQIPNEYNKNTITIPIGAILIAPKSEVSSSFYTTKNNINKMNKLIETDKNKRPYTQGYYSGTTMQLGLYEGLIANRKILYRQRYYQRI